MLLLLYFFPSLTVSLFLLCKPFLPFPPLSFNLLYSTLSLEVLFSCYSSSLSLSLSLSHSPFSLFILCLHCTYFLCHFSFNLQTLFSIVAYLKIYFFSLSLSFSTPQSYLNDATLCCFLSYCTLTFYSTPPFPLPLAIKLFSAFYDISIKWHNEIGRVQRLLLQAAND